MKWLIHIQHSKVMISWVLNLFCYNPDTLLVNIVYKLGGSKCKVSVSLLRLNKKGFKYVITKISPKLEAQERSFAVPNELKLAVTIRIPGESSYLKGAENDYSIGLCQYSVSKILKGCVDAMPGDLCGIWMSFDVVDNEIINPSGFIMASNCNNSGAASSICVKINCLFMHPPGARHSNL